jgi:hypothetical protein
MDRILSVVLFKDYVVVILGSLSILGHMFMTSESIEINLMNKFVQVLFISKSKILLFDFILLFTINFTFINKNFLEYSLVEKGSPLEKLAGAIKVIGSLIIGCSIKPILRYYLGWESKIFNSPVGINFLLKGNVEKFQEYILNEASKH